jgi:hypothetical protein
MKWTAVSAWIALAFVQPAGLRAQAASDLLSGARSVAVVRSEVPQARTSIADRIPLDATPLLSALVPGLGQVKLKQDRFIAYMATEAYFLLQYVKSNRENDDNAMTYRSIARDIARRGFVANPPDTLWKYYEQVGEYVESGVFSMTSTGPTIPDTDPTTFNGFQWLQARRNVGGPLNDPSATGWPGYQEALDFYESRAVRQPYRWSWLNAQLERDLYQRAIRRSDTAKKHARNNLIALGANHVLSTIDAFASVRLIQAAEGDMRLSASIPIR